MVWRYAYGMDIILRLTFVTFFSHFELSHFSGSNTIKVYRCGPTILCRSFWNNCFCHDLKMCLWFGLDIILRLFCHFFRILNLVFFQTWILSMCIDTEYLVCATPPTVLCRSLLNFMFFFCFFFFCSLKMCMWFIIILRLMVIPFSAFWT